MLQNYIKIVIYHIRQGNKGKNEKSNRGLILVEPLISSQLLIFRDPQTACCYRAPNRLSPALTQSLAPLRLFYCSNHLLALLFLFPLYLPIPLLNAHLLTNFLPGIPAKWFMSVNLLRRFHTVPNHSACSDVGSEMKETCKSFMKWELEVMMKSKTCGTRSWVLIH